MNNLRLVKGDTMESIINKGAGKRYARQQKLEDEIYKSCLIDRLEKEIEFLRIETLDEEFRMKRKKQNELYDKFIQRLKDKRK
jgi:hypothetical protein